MFGCPDEHWAAEVSLDTGDLRSQAEAGHPEDSSGGGEGGVRSDVGQSLQPFPSTLCCHGRHQPSRNVGVKSTDVVYDVVV